MQWLVVCMADGEVQCGVLLRKAWFATRKLGGLSCSDLLLQIVWLHTGSWVAARWPVLGECVWVFAPVNCMPTHEMTQLVGWLV